MRRIALSGLLVGLLALPARGEVLGALGSPDYSPTIPTLQSVLGFEWGEEMTDPGQALTYARALAAAVPERARLMEFGRSLEGWPLVLLVVSSEVNLAGLEDIRARLAELGDARRTPPTRAAELARRLPAVVWFACSVHGDEPSGTDAGLALAYHLLAARTPEVTETLEKTIVIIDVMQNPDGRARFVTSNRQARGIEPDPHPMAAERVQPWPGGRFSHALFDLNRDWIILSHPESAARVTAMLQWLPQVVADLHEMGAEQGYFFAPPAIPHNPLISRGQVALWEAFGRAKGAAFDQRGWRFWTREMFDAFYPGYGESWPLFTGAVGMTFEQGSSRGLRVRLEDGSLLTYADTVAHQLVASYMTVTVTAARREEVLATWAEYRRAAVQEGGKRAWVIEPGSDPRGAAALADLLVRQGIEVLRVGKAAGGLAAGAFVVPAGQPLGRLAAVLLDRHHSMGKEFEAEQERRDARRLGDEIYDLTAWSLPLLWGVPVRGGVDLPVGLAVEPVRAGDLPPGRISGAGRVAFVVRWEGPSTAAALVALLREGIRVGVAEKPFVIAGRSFPMGSLVIRRAGNPEDLMARLMPIAASSGVEFVGVDASYVDEGIDLGSNRVRALRLPAVGVLWDEPTAATSAGHLRFALERFFGCPVTALRGRTLTQARLAEFGVLILPDSWESGRYAEILGQAGASRLAAWVREGGVLIAVGNAAGWLTTEGVGLLASSLEKRGGAKADVEGKGPAAAPPAARGDVYEEVARPSEEEPPNVPGAILRVKLDEEHLLAAGLAGGQVNVLVNSRRVFTPLKLGKGVNVGVYAGREELVQAGFVLAASREQLPGKAYLLVQKHGRGAVVAFAEDPAFRALPRASMLLLANAVLFGQTL